MPGSFPPGRCRCLKIRPTIPARRFTRAVLLQLSFGLLFVPCRLAPAAPFEAAEPKEELRVEIEGLGGVIESYLPTGDLKKNVLSILSIEGAGNAGNLTESRIRELHAAAPEEIRTALQPYGFYKPVITPALARAPDGTFVARYAIDPGPPLRYESVTFTIDGEGADLFKPLVDDSVLRPGAIVNHADYELAKKVVQDEAGERGYVRAAFTVHRVEVDLEAYVARAVLHLETGRAYRFGKVRFQQDFLDEAVIRGYVTWTEGDPLKLSELLKMQEALANSPYFSRVEVEMRVEEAVGTGSHRVPVDVTLLPSKRQKYLFGAGYGTDTGFRGNVGVELRRLNRKGHHASAEARVSDLEKSISARFLIPGRYPRTDFLALMVAYADLTPTTSKSRTFLSGPTYSWSAGRWLPTISLLFQRDTFTVGLDSGTTNLLTPEFTLTRVVADDRIETTNGHRLRFETRGSVNGVLSSASFFQVKAAGKLIRTLGAGFRVLGRAELGVTATSEFRELPPRMRHFTGGALSVRGFAYESLGGRDEAGNVIGGRFLRVASVEVDKKVLDRWGGFRAAVFADTGNASIDFGGNLETGVGVGLRWRSPIGLVRGDVAWAVSQPGSPIKLHLNIGPDL